MHRSTLSKNKKFRLSSSYVYRNFYQCPALIKRGSLMWKRASLKQIFYHRSQSPSLVGALYKGRVAKITKSLNYAFIDLGLERTGFLYGKDLAGKTKEVAKVLKPGQEVLVQIKADPLRNKGVRLNMEIGLAGLYLVYLPEQKTKTTISRQINSSEERQRLNEIVSGFEEKGALIVRTFAQGHEKKDLEADLLKLKEQWGGNSKQIQKSSPPWTTSTGGGPFAGILKRYFEFEDQPFCRG